MGLLKVRKGIEKADNVLFNFITAIEGILLIVMILINVLQTFSRYAINFPVWWVMDLSILLFLVNTGLGMAVAWTRNSHLILDLTENLFPKVIKSITWWLCQLVMFAGGIMLFGLALYNVELYKKMVISLLGYPESLKSWVVGIAGLLLSLAALFKIIEKVLDYIIDRQRLCENTQDSPSSEA